MQFHDRLKFTTTGTNAASISDGTATLGCRNIAKVISDTSGQVTALVVGSQNVPFTIEDGTGKWEDSLFTVGGTSSSPTLTRTQVLASSAGGTNAETFSGATLTVFNTVPGKILSCVAVDNFPTTFSTTVPLTQIGTVHMPRQTVSGNLTFTAAANAVKGAYAEYPLILDGSSTLTFTGFTEHGSSAGLLNTSGMPNTLFFWYDGYTYWWSASQAATPVAIDIIAPTMTSAAVANATPATVTLTASESLDSNYVPAASAFAISGHTVLAVTGVSGTSVTLSVSAAFVNGEAAQSASYTQPATNGLRDLAGNLMVSFTGLAITNNVAAVDTQPPAFSSAQVANASPTVVQVTMSETLAASVPPTSAFAITEAGSAKTVSSVSVSGAVVSITCSAAFSNGTAIQLTYTQPGANPRIQDAAGNLTSTFGPVTVTNNVSAPAVSYPQLTSLSSSTSQTGSGPYTITGSGVGTGTGGVNDIATEKGGLTTLGATGDFTIDWQVLNAAAEVAAGIRSVQSTNTFTNMLAGFYSTPGTGAVPAHYRRQGGADNATLPQAGDVVRMARTGSSLTLSIQRNGTGAFTVIDTWTSITTSKVWVDFFCCSTSSAQLLAWTGFA